MSTNVFENKIIFLLNTFVFVYIIYSQLIGIVCVSACKLAHPLGLTWWYKSANFPNYSHWLSDDCVKVHETSYIYVRVCERKKSVKSEEK